MNPSLMCRLLVYNKSKSKQKVSGAFLCESKIPNFRGGACIPPDPLKGHAAAPSHFNRFFSPLFRLNEPATITASPSKPAVSCLYHVFVM